MFPVIAQQMYVKKISKPVWYSRIGRDKRGQELIGYATIAAFVAVGAGPFIPVATSKIGVMLSMVGHALNAAGA
jgi:hypothetical protein